MPGPISRNQTTALSGNVRVASSIACAIAALSALPARVSAHTSNAVAPRDIWHAWTPDPVVIVLSLVAGWLYAHGAGNLRAIGERTGRGAIISTGRMTCFYCGVGVFLIALSSPLDTVTATVFSAHMIQHILLISVAPPLVLLGNPMTVIMNGLPRAWRRPVARIEHRVPGLSALLAFLTAPIAAFIVHVATLWFWHVPYLYDAAVHHEKLHLLEHMTFVVTAFFYWWKIIPATKVASRTVGPAMGILSVFAMGMQGAVLGTILTFSGSLIYPVYSGRSELWGISALSDQRLAGLIMWIPAGSVYVAVALMLLAMWFREEDDDAEGQSADGALSASARIGQSHRGHATVG